MKNILRKWVKMNTTTKVVVGTIVIAAVILPCGFLVLGALAAKLRK